MKTQNTKSSIGTELKVFIDEKNNHMYYQQGILLCSDSSKMPTSACRILPNNALLKDPTRVQPHYWIVGAT